MTNAVISKIKNVKLPIPNLHWEAEDVWKLLLESGRSDLEDVARNVGRSNREVVAKSAVLRLQSLIPGPSPLKNDLKVWNPFHLDWLRSYASMYSLATLAQCLKRSECQIEFVMEYEGIPSLSPVKAHKVHISSLSLSTLDLADNPVSQAIQKVIDSVGEFQPTTHPIVAGSRTGKKWTEAELNFLEQTFGTHSVEEVASFLGRTPSAVNKKRDSIPGLVFRATNQD